MLSLPLQKSKNYKVNWNYHLATRGSQPLPDWWYTAKTTLLSDADAQNYKWCKDISELPTQTGSDGKKIWKIFKRKTKEGVESWSYPIYQLTETSKHSSKAQAGWCVSAKSGKIDHPDNGDFGIVQKLGGNWLCEGGSISYDGKHWIASRTYAHSPDGWDADLYSEVQGGK